MLTVINFAIKFIPWNFLKRKLESEASRCSFASSSSSSFMPVGSNNRKPLWSWDGFCRPERPLIPVACEVWNPLMPGWCAKGSAYWQTRAKLGKDGGRGLSRLLEEMQAQAWKIWTQSERRNRISHPLMNFLAVFIVFFPHVAVIRWIDGHIAAGGL